MKGMIRIADSKGRITLPGFANSPVIIDVIGADEYRVRKAQVIPADELRFSEAEAAIELSERDARCFMETLASPPPPNRAARRAAKRFKANHG